MSVDQFISRAAIAQRAVATLTLDERIARAQDTRSRLVEYGEDIVAAQVAELGRPRAFARRELASALDLLGAIPAFAEAIRPREVASTTGETCLSWLPYGVVLGWHAANSPVWVPTLVAASALVGGNAVVSRPSRRTRASTGLVLEAFAATWPEDAVSTCELAPAEAEALVAHPGIHAVVAHASTRTCRRHLSLLGEAYARGAPLRPYIPEASGNDAFVVLEGADVDRAARAAALAGFANGGQLCMAAKRLIVERSCSEEFIARLAAEVGGLVLGDPDHERTDIAPMPDGGARRQARAMLAEAIALGGEVIVGSGEQGPFFTPTVVLMPEGAADAELWSDECFAPLRGLMVADDPGHAAELAGATRFGLGISIFGPTPAADELARQVRTARVMINADPLTQDPQLVVGGVGDSGFHGARPKIEQLVFARRTHRDR